MPSLSGALQKLHIRRRSDAASTPPASPSKPVTSGAGRTSVDQEARGYNVPGGQSGIMGSPSSPATMEATAHSQGGPAVGDRRSSLDVSGVDKSLPPVPGSTATNNIVGNVKRRGSIPRSPGKFALPTIPNTPAAEALERERELTLGGGHEGNQEILRTPDEREGYRGIGEQIVAERGIQAPQGHAAAYLPATSSVAVMSDDRSKSALIWRDGSQDQVINKKYDLSPPQPLFPITLPTADQVINGDYSIVPSEKHQPTRQLERSDGNATVTKKPWNPAYVATRVLSDHPYPPAATEAECAAHLQRHLALLPATIFSPASAHLAARAKPGRALTLQAGPLVAAAQRDVELDRQREELIGRLVQYEEEAVASNRRFEKAALLESPRPEKIWAFEQVGWKDRLEILDTVDITTTVLEPVIQEHVTPVEITYYTYIINREIHKYHIYPYVQPIVDPNPRVMPTRHLFKDRDGNWREVYGDEAAEAILGKRLVLDGSDGAKRYTERWIEGVDGVQYELLERESVTVGHRAWVQRFGDRPNFHTASYGNTAAGSSGVMSTSSTGPLALNKKTNTRVPKVSRESHASPLRQEVARDVRGEEAVGRAL
ncbi:hypothetical protein QFC22_002298 [Naganishia vaughanmartiniae]|uniref:Uncharacterized protein n=1 Tax=Naganishia vaughanmartiniae TaxID=1424756 RepID=A0ACC2XCY2_9TREE|nr:hypothetical protein QFC22_002298 [Naganishia vaughanmartiniae]